MNPTGPMPPQEKRYVPVPWIAAGIVALFLFLCGVGITGIFRLSSDTAALRRGVMGAAPGAWQKKIALRVGFITTGLVRMGASCFNLPPEARAAMKTIHGAEVGIYNLTDSVQQVNQSAMIEAADKAMTHRGWTRIVGVVEGQDLVAVYVPDGKVSLTGVRCCALVFKDRQLVLACGKANLEPLLELARTKGFVPPWEQAMSKFAQATPPPAPPGPSSSPQLE